MYYADASGQRLYNKEKVVQIERITYICMQQFLTLSICSDVHSLEDKKKKVDKHQASLH